jgi:hypothetical protein
VKKGHGAGLKVQGMGHRAQRQVQSLKFQVSSLKICKRLINKLGTWNFEPYLVERWPLTADKAA